MDTDNINDGRSVMTIPHDGRSVMTIPHDGRSVMTIPHMDQLKKQNLRDISN